MFNALHDIVVIKPEKAIETTKSGIYLAPQAIKPSYRGEVVKVGPKVSDIKAGDTGVYTEHTGEKYEYEGENYILIHEKDLMGYIPA